MKEKADSALETSKKLKETDAGIEKDDFLVFKSRKTRADPLRLAPCALTSISLPGALGIGGERAGTDQGE